MGPDGITPEFRDIKPVVPPSEDASGQFLKVVQNPYHESPPVTPPTENQEKWRPQARGSAGVVAWLAIGLIVFAAGILGALYVFRITQQTKTTNSANIKSATVLDVPLSDLTAAGLLSTGSATRLAINGQLDINNSLVVTPNDTPANPVLGQIYVNKADGQIYYYDGEAFVNLLNSGSVQTILTLGSGGNTTTLQATNYTNTNIITVPDSSGTVAVSATGNIALSPEGQISFTGVLPVVNGGTGLGSTPSAGQLLIGNGAGYSLNTLSAGTGVTIDNTEGAIMISTTASGTCAACATTSLNNLSNVAINTALLPGSTGIDLGSSTSAFNNAYLTGTLQAATVDSPTAAALNFGTTNATAINLNQNTVVGSGKTLAVYGNALFQPATDSTSAFQIQNAVGGSLLNVNSADSNITLLGNNSGELSSWATASNALPTNIDYETSVTHNGYIYALAGLNGSTPQSAVYYAKLNADGSVGTWNTAANALPGPRRGASSVVANGYVYVMGGYNGTSDQTTTYYAKLNADGSVGTWNTAANALPGPRRGSSSVVANGYVYMMGGFNSTTNLPNTTVYYAKLNADGSVGTWNTAANALPATRQWSASVTANGYVYILGGILNSVVYYAKLNADGSVGTWNTAANALPASRGYIQGGGVTANGYVYVLGGYDGTNAQSTVYYAKLNADGSVGTWNTAANALPAPRQRAASVTVNGYIYVLGGANSANTQQSTVYYASLPRLQIGAANLDLVGLQGQTLADPGDFSQGSTGGSITAGNGTFVGSLQVQGQANFTNAVSIRGTLSAGDSVAFRNATDSTTAFQVQNAAGTSLLTADTSNVRINIGTLGTPIGQLYVSGQLPTDSIGSVGTTGNLKGLVVKGNYAYAVGTFNPQTVKVIDISNPAAPVIVGSLSTSNTPHSIAVEGNYAYVSELTGQLEIFSVINPTSPSLVATLATGNCNGIQVQGKYVYMNCSGSLRVIDVSNPLRPFTAKTVTNSLSTAGLHIQGKYLYVSYFQTNSIEIFDISNPIDPISKSLYTTVDSNPTNLVSANSLYVQGRYAYVPTYDPNNSKAGYLDIVDVSNPSSPTTTGRVALTNNRNPNGIYVQGRYAYIANQDTKTISVVDVSSASSPVVVGSMPTTSGDPQAIVVQGRYAYLTSGGTGTRSLQIFDLGGAYVQQLTTGGLQTSTLQVDTNVNVGGEIYTQGGLYVGQSAQVLGNLGVSGSVLFANSADSTTAFQVQNASGTAILSINTTSGLLNVGSGATGTTAAKLLVLDNKTTTGDPTIVNGAMYYNQATATFRCGRDGFWSDCAINEIDHNYNFEDDFIGGGNTAGGPNGQVGWYASGTCVAPTYNAQATALRGHDHPGVIQNKSGNTSGDICIMGQAAPTTTVAAGDVIKTTTALEGTVGNVVYRTGWTNQGATASSQPTSGVWWEADTTTNSRWRYCYANNGAPTCATNSNATPTVATNTWIKLEIRIVSTTAIDFLYNGTTVSLTGITFDTGATNLLGPTMACGTRTAATQTCNVDYFQWRGVVSTSGGR